MEISVTPDFMLYTFMRQTKTINMVNSFLC